MDVNLKTIKFHSATKYYSPFNFLSNSDASGIEWLEDLQLDFINGEVKLFSDVGGTEIYYRKLSWDSDFFGIPTFRIDYSVFSDAINKDFSLAFKALSEFLALAHAEFYLFAEIPSEDIRVISAMTGAGYKLIETRLTYVKDDVKNFTLPKRPLVRAANLDDISALKQVAISSVNIFDRFHADKFFTSDEADAFLGKYVENSVLGFADEVMIPGDGLSNAFLTANYIDPPSFLSNRKLGKMVLSAVAPERRGWYVKLIGEMTMKFKELGVDTAFMTTQSTNRAVLKVWSSFGYRFARCTHILSTYKRNI